MAPEIASGTSECSTSAAFAAPELAASNCSHFLFFKAASASTVFHVLSTPLLIVRMMSRPPSSTFLTLLLEKTWYLCISFLASEQDGEPPNSGQIWLFQLNWIPLESPPFGVISGSLKLLEAQQIGNPNVFSNLPSVRIRRSPGYQVTTGRPDGAFWRGSFPPQLAPGWKKSKKSSEQKWSHRIIELQNHPRAPRSWFSGFYQL